MIFTSSSSLPQEVFSSPFPSTPDVDVWHPWPQSHIVRRHLTRRKWSILTLYQWGHFDAIEAIAQIERGGYLIGIDLPVDPPDFELFLDLFIISERKAASSLNGEK